MNERSAFFFRSLSLPREYRLIGFGTEYRVTPSYILIDQKLGGPEVFHRLLERYRPPLLTGHRFVVAVQEARVNRWPSFTVFAVRPNTATAARVG